MKRLLPLLLLFAASAMTPANEAHAETPVDAARTLGEQGVQLYNEGRYRDALELLKRAEELHHAPTLIIFMARCQDKLGKMLDARRMYQRVLDEARLEGAPAQYLKARDNAKAELEDLNVRIPRIVLSVDGPEPKQVTLELDGERIPHAEWNGVEINPGGHLIKATAEGFEPASDTVTLQSGSTTPVVLKMPAIAGNDEGDAVEPFPLWPSLALLGVGGAGLLVGTITGSLHIAKTNDLKDNCSDDSCPNAAPADVDSARTLATVSTVTFVLGSVFAAAGGGLLAYTLWSEDDQTAIRLGPTGITLTTHF
jgi:hypothetical protein